jgi:hypothetical protein
MSPCRRTASRLPARWWRLSTFWVNKRKTPGWRRPKSAKTQCPALGWACWTPPRVRRTSPRPIPGRRENRPRSPTGPGQTATTAQSSRLEMSGCHFLRSSRRRSGRKARRLDPPHRATRRERA